MKCSQTLYDDIAKHGGKPIMWKAGHSLIKAKMKEEHAQLAGEMSGHIFFKHRYFGFDDAHLLRRAPAGDPRRTRRGRSRELLADVPKTFATPEIRVDTRRRRSSSSWSAPPSSLRKSGHRPSTWTACASSSTDGWGLVRASNTQPLLVLRFEAQHRGALQEIQQLIEGTVQQIRRELK